ncbi:MAG: TonB-dependent receptor [Deltaproteobacteria bacterium]|nr:TonB-dependent receptor [Deltaproteobacteria bacterium]
MLSKKRSNYPIIFLPIFIQIIFTFFVLPSASASGNDASKKPVYLGEISSTYLKKILSKEEKKLKKMDLKYTKREIFKSTQSKLVINKDELKASSPVGGATQALSIMPGVRSETYGPTGATRGSFSINGIQQGWGGLIGETDDGSIAVTFDGVPMGNPGSGLWSTALMPEMSLISRINVIYGPGNPADRWYNALGGTLGFIPLQPPLKSGGSLSLTYGSFNTKNINFNIKTGMIGGYSAVLAGGITSSNSYRTGFGFYNPTADYAYYGKVVKVFSNGNIGLGAYITHSQGYRPTFIPASPIYPGNGNQGVTVNGYYPNGNSMPGPYFSQETSGYYSSLAFDIWNKLARNRMYLVYSPINLKVSKSVSFHNLAWYREGERLHYHQNDFSQGAGNLYEYNNPEDEVYGDKTYFDINAPHNLIKFGGWFLKSHYISRNAFYNPFGTYCTAQPSGTSEVTTITDPCAYRYSDFYQTFGSAFVQDTLHFFKKLKITPGLNFVTFKTNFYNNASQYYPQAVLLNPYGNDDTIPGHNGPQAPNASTYFEKLEPSLGVNYKLTNNAAIYGNYSDAYQNPHLGGGGGPFQQIGANALEPEKNQYYTAGFKVLVPHDDLLNNFVLNVNYYREHFSNMLLSYTLANGTSTYASGSSNYNGVNLYAEDNPVSNLHLFTNISYEKAVYSTYITGGVNYNGDNVPYVPEETFNLGAYYNLLINHITYSPKIWDIYTGKQDIMDDVTGAPSSQTIPSFNVLNASISAKIPFNNRQAGLPKAAIVKLTVLNLLNHKYNEYEYITAGGYFGGNSAGQVLAYPGMPIATYLTMTLKF